MKTHLHERAIQVDILELDAVVLHVDVEVAVTRTDGTIAFNDPAFGIVERWRECHCVPDERTVA